MACKVVADLIELAHAKHKNIHYKMVFSFCAVILWFRGSSFFSTPSQKNWMENIDFFVNKVSKVFKF
jgi:hypothetical protein